MKKYLPILLLIVLTIPTVVSAAWWNPFSWSTFRRTDNKTQILENRVKELEKKLENTATSTATSSKELNKKPTPTPLPVKTPSLKAKNEPQVKKINNQGLTKVEIAKFISSLKEGIEGTDKIKRDYDRRVTSEIRPQMAEYPSNQLLQQAGQDLISEFNNNIVLMSKGDVEATKLIDSMTTYLNSDVSLTLDEASTLSQNLRYYNQLYDGSQVKLKALILAFLKIYNSALNGETTRLDGLINQANQSSVQTSSNNSSSNKQAQLNAINQRIANLNAKYAQDIANVDIVLSSEGGTIAVSNSQKAEIDKKYREAYNALKAEYQQIQYSN